MLPRRYQQTWSRCAAGCGCLYLRTAAPEVLATAKAQRWDPAEGLRVLLDEEVRGRDEATRAMRRKAAETGLVITVCHFPPGTSKWNKIEHRLFSHTSMKWRGRDLTSHDVIVNTIAATTPRTGLAVHAELDTAEYRVGVKIPDKRMRQLETTDVLTRHTLARRMELHTCARNPTPDQAEPFHGRP